jgi:hypothetical protein
MRHSRASTEAAQQSSPKRRAYEILISDNNLMHGPISVAAAVPEWVFVLNLHCERCRLPIGLTIDPG